MFQKTTHGITVTAQPQFLKEYSQASDNHYVWSYTISLENHAGETVQLINRYWHITDEHGLVQEVQGAGVIGQQPVLQEGEAFSYTSGASLTTPSGVMVGRYEMKDAAGTPFTIDIPAFSLDSPYRVGLVN